MKEQKKSSWGAAMVSFFKEYLFNFSGPGHLYYDENLTNEGKRKKNYIWRVLLLVTAVGVALLPFIAWNMFVPDVLWAKIVTVVVCEGYVIFIVGMEIIQIKDELKEDMLKIGGYKITPKGSISPVSYTHLSKKLAGGWCITSFVLLGMGVAKVLSSSVEYTAMIRIASLCSYFCSLGSILGVFHLVKYFAVKKWEVEK